MRAKTASLSLQDGVRHWLDTAQPLVWHHCWNPFVGVVAAVETDDKTKIDGLLASQADKKLNDIFSGPPKVETFSFPQFSFLFFFFYRCCCWYHFTEKVTCFIKSSVGVWQLCSHGNSIVQVHTVVYSTLDTRTLSQFMQLLYVISVTFCQKKRVAWTTFQKQITTIANR